MGWSELYARAASQFGLVTPACIRAAGLPSTTFYDRVRREAWVSPYPATFLVPGASLTHRTQIAAAQLAVGGLAPAAAWSAAYLHGLVKSPPSTVQLLVAAPRRPRASEKLEVRRSHTLVPDHCTHVEGLSVTTFERTLLDLAGSTTLDQLRSFAIDGRHGGQYDLGELLDLTEQHTKVAGRSRLVRVIEDLEGDGSDSGFEFSAVRRLAQAGLPVDAQQIPVRTETGTRYVDLGYTPVKVGIECVGFAYHGSREDFENDAVRNNAIAALDEWLVLKLTWRIFHQRWDGFLSSLVAVLERRGYPVPR